MDSKFTIGQKLIIELSSGECYIGELKVSNKYYLELDDVYDAVEKEHINNSQRFFASDISSIKVIQDVICTKERNSEIESCDSSSIIDENDLQTPGITLDDLKETENRIRDAVYIFQTDRLYHDAVKDLSKRKSVLISLESCKRGRHSESSLLTFGTKDKIYIFDIKLLGRIHPELRHILEANEPKKILHDGRKTADSLWIKHNINMSSIFDTLVAHIATRGDKSITNLTQCLQKYLNVPISILFNDEDAKWHERPLDDNCKAITVKKVIFIYKLYNVLLHKYILRDFYKICKNFARVYQTLDWTDVATDIVSTNQNSLETITDIDLELSNAMDALINPEGHSEHSSKSS